jgi:serine/threonine protein phosphatase PrpC
MEALAAALDEGLPAEQAGWQDILCAAFAAARLALESLAEIEEQPLRAYAATLSLVVVSADRLAVAQLGDGAVVTGVSTDE